MAPLLSATILFPLRLPPWMVSPLEQGLSDPCPEHQAPAESAPAECCGQLELSKYGLLELLPLLGNAYLSFFFKLSSLTWYRVQNPTPGSNKDAQLLPAHSS